MLIRKLKISTQHKGSTVSIGKNATWVQPLALPGRLDSLGNHLRALKLSLLISIEGQYYQTPNIGIVK